MDRRPLTFEPLFMERVWGGRRLAERFGKPLPDGVVIGESWELVDRPEAQSVVVEGEFAGGSLGSLWRSSDREALFGAGTEALGDRFPLLIKLLDCKHTLSVQVHPPADVAASLGGEPKTEMWIVLDATPDAHLLTGLRSGVTREAFEAALSAGQDVPALLHRHDAVPGDVMFLPSGRVHAIGAGNMILEIQQNSDTTYRVFDFNRPGLDGKPRELHVPESMASINWADPAPGLVEAQDEVLVHNEIFEVDRLQVRAGSGVEAAPAGRCAALMALDGAVSCDGVDFAAGQLFLLPADGDSRELTPAAGASAVTVVRAMLPAGA